MRRADRMIDLINFLRSRRRAVTASVIAEHFGICTRTVYRDIHELMNIGIPIQGEAGVGYVIDNSYYLPPLCFDIEELEAISLGISMVRLWTDEQFAETAHRALTKVQTILPPALQYEMQQLAPYPRSPEKVIPWTVSFTELRESIRTKCRLSIEYIDENSSKTRRHIRPLALIFAPPVWMLAAWCEKRQSFRHFRLDRINSVCKQGAIFDSEDGKDLAAYLAHDYACKV